MVCLVLILCFLQLHQLVVVTAEKIVRLVDQAVQAVVAHTQAAAARVLLIKVTQVVQVALGQIKVLVEVEVHQLSVAVVQAQQVAMVVTV
jgi:hypothetical protein